MSWRHLRTALVFFATATLSAASVQAQYYYPYGYGGWGWGGFSYASGLGMEAAGLGNLAAGVGSYNLQTAQATAINANTLVNFNEYMYQSLMEYDRKLYAQKQKEIKDYQTAAEATQDRLRNHPTQNDIVNGDALNIAITELSDPKYSSAVWLEAAKIKVPGKWIENISFNSPTAALTGTLDKLTDADPPPLLQTNEFASDVAAYRKVCDELNKQAADTGDVKPATVKQFRQVLQGIADKIKASSNIDQDKKNTAEMHLKALLGLSYILDGPDLDVFLAGVGDLKDVPLERLLSFMRSFQVRFGPATNPNQVEVYNELYRMLTGLRDKIFGTGTGTLPASATPVSGDDPRPKKFFNGMHLDELHPDKDRTPPPPPKPGNAK